MGTLERVPHFVADEKAFHGYVKIYGTDINFIDEAGTIVDSVPVAGHLRHRPATLYWPETLKV